MNNCARLFVLVLYSNKNLIVIYITQGYDFSFLSLLNVVKVIKEQVERYVKKQSILVILYYLPQKTLHNIIYLCCRKHKSFLIIYLPQKQYIHTLSVQNFQMNDVTSLTGHLIILQRITCFDQSFWEQRQNHFKGVCV